MEHLSALESGGPSQAGWGYRVIVPVVEASFIGVDLLPVALELIERQGLTGAAQGLAAEWLALTQLLLPFVKGDRRITTRIQSEKHRFGCVVDAHADGSQRGRVTPAQLSWPSGRAGPLCHHGLASITLWPEGEGEPSTSQVAVPELAIEEVLDQLAVHSFQLPLRSAIVASFDLKGTLTALRGWALASLPGGTPEDLADFASRLRAADPQLDRVADQTVDTLLSELADSELVIPTPFAPVHRCPCDSEQFVRALATLGSEDLRSLAEERDRTEVRCEYCADTYIFDANDLRDLASALET